ncbi:MAG: molybdopterin cofactor-binding domain-containing protein [Spongiibacteraceae bacterium]
MTIDVQMNRRQFIVAAAAIGGGLALGFHNEWGNAATPAGAAASEFNPWLVIHPDNSVVIRVTTPEVGTGAATQLAMTVCEELQCDWSKVRIEYGTLNDDDNNHKIFTKSVPVFAFFSGRSTQTERNKTLLQVGASARERLKLAAAQVWKVPVSEVTAENSVLTHKVSGKTLTYGAVAARAATVKLAVEPALKPQNEWTSLGKKSPSKLHIPQIVNGSAQYGIDIRLPGMLYAALMQSPVQDGQVKSYDFAKIKHMPGVRGIAVIKGGAALKVSQGLASQPWSMADDRTGAVAVVADHYWQARKALEALPLEWEDGAGVRWKNTEQIFDAAKKALDETGGIVRKDSGEVEAELAKQPKIIEATYTTPYCDQAPIEPLNGTALVTPERIDLWHPTQIADNARAAVYEETGLAPEKIFVHQTLIGGAFGRRTTCDDVRMVVAVAAQFPGKPVHVIWSREETMRQGRYRALTAIKLKAGLDKDGMPQALIAHSAARAANARPPFSTSVQFSPTTMGLLDGSYVGTIVPHTKVVTHELPVHIRTGAYRGPHYNSTCFMVESFIDECAHAAKIDPLEYRLRLHAKWPDPGWTACLKEAAKQAEWGKPLPKGMARGIAIGNFGMFGQPQAGTTVCTIAKVEVSSKGELKVHQIDLALDCGSLMNPDAVRAQMEGGTIFGMNMALNEKLTVQDGRIVEGNFDVYPMLHMADMPQINIHFGALTQHERFAELGEAPTGTVGPAIANAIFAVTGKRLRSMPFRDHDLSWS